MSGEKREIGKRRPSFRGVVNFMTGKKDEKDSANSAQLDPLATATSSQQQPVLNGEGLDGSSNHSNDGHGSNGKASPTPTISSQQQSVPSGPNGLDDSSHSIHSSRSNGKASPTPTPGYGAIGTSLLLTEKERAGIKQLIDAERQKLVTDPEYAASQQREEEARAKRLVNHSRVQELVASMREKVSQGGDLETQDSEELTRLSDEILGGFVDAKKPRYTQRVEIKGKLKDALTSHLTGSTDALKAKLVNGAHKDKISKVHGLILDKFEPLAKEASEKKLKEFTTWFDSILEDHKDAFPEDNKIWHDIVKPALMALLGVIVTLVTAVARPFVTGVADYANSFFVKPDTAGFEAFKEDATQLRGKLEEEVTTSVAALGA